MDLRFNGLAISLKSILGLSIVILLSEASLASTMLDVLKVEGKVFRLSDKGTSEGVLKGGEKLNEGDQIRVSSQSRVLLGDEDSKFWAGSNSSLVIRSGEAVENSDKKRKVISLLSGNLRVKIKTGEGAKFQIRSKSAVAGVRGTEFFFSNEKENITFCVLEGLAWLKDEKSGNQFDVKEGAGIVLLADGSVQKTFTPEQVKYDWVDMTEFADQRRLTGSFYAPEKQPTKLGKNWAYKYSLFGLARTYENRDYWWSKKDPNHDDQYHAVFAPSLIYNNSGFKAQVTPRAIHIKADQKRQWDDMPSYSDKHANYLYFQEAFAGYGQEKWNVRAGIFQLVWKENALFQDRPWMWDSLSHQGVHGYYDFALNNTNLKLEAVSTKGKEYDDLSVLEPLTLISMNALRLTDAKDRGSITLLERDTGDSIVPSTAKRTATSATDLATLARGVNYKSGTKVREAIFSLRDTHQYFDYNVTAGFQTGTAFKDLSTETSISGKSMDASLGVPLPFQFRIQARYVYADPNYVPGIEDYYEMGFVGRFFHTNIKQQRYMIEKAFGDIHRIRVEFLTSRAAGNSKFGTYQTSGRNRRVAGDVLAEETDLMWLANWTDSIQTFASIWLFDTGLYLNRTTNKTLGSDPAWGSVLGVRFTH